MRRFAITGLFALAVLLGALAAIGCTALTQVPHRNSDGTRQVEHIGSTLGYVHQVDRFRSNGSLEQVEYYYTDFCHYCSVEERQRFKRLKQVDHYSPHQTLEWSLEYSFSGALRKASVYRLDGGLERADYFRRNGSLERSEYYAFGGAVRQVDRFRSNGSLEVKVFLDLEGNLLEEQLYALDGRTLEQVTRSATPN